MQDTQLIAPTMSSRDLAWAMRGSAATAERRKTREDSFAVCGADAGSAECADDVEPDSTSMVVRGCGGSLVIDSGRACLEIMPSGDARFLEKSVCEDGRPNILEIGGLPAGRLEIVDNGQIAASVRLVGEDGKSVVTFRVMRHESFVDVVQDRGSAHVCTFRPQRGIGDVAFNGPYGMAQAPEESSHELSVVTLTTPMVEDVCTGGFYVAHQGKPYFECASIEGTVTCQLTDGKSHMRVGLMEACENH